MLPWYDRTHTHPHPHTPTHPHTVWNAQAPHDLFLRLFPTFNVAVFVDDVDADAIIQVAGALLMPIQVVEGASHMWECALVLVPIFASACVLVSQVPADSLSFFHRRQRSASR